jgi:uncharacterized membrane protein YdjX (TVP38/TMEM64 family)
MAQIKRFFPLIFFLLFLLALWTLFSIWPWTLSDIAPYEAYLIASVKEHLVLTSLFYCLAYIGVTLFALPLAAPLSILGGYLFLQPLALIYVVGSASLGSILFYLWFSRYSRRMQSVLKKVVVIKQVLKKGAFRYLLILRLIPIFPFWLINVAAALFRVGASVFFVATLVGVIPGSFAFTQIGVGLSELVAADEVGFSTIFNKPILTGLAIMILLIIASLFFKPSKQQEEEIEDDDDEE